MADKASTTDHELGEQSVYSAESLAEQTCIGEPARSERPAAKAAVILPKTLGPYEVVEVIGRVGMGMVLKCRDNELKREVAIKVLNPDARSDGVARTRFIKEAQITGRLEHPGIVAVHLLDWDEDDQA